MAIIKEHTIRAATNQQGERVYQIISPRGEAISACQSQKQALERAAAFDRLCRVAA